MDLFTVVWRLLKLIKEVDENKVNKMLKGWEVPARKSDAQAWAELSAKLDMSPAKVSKVVKMRWIPWAAAASIAAVVIMVIGLWPATEVITSVSDPGVHLEVVLPDGSVALLNSSSRLEFSNEWSANREMRLEGEAFFEVKKGEKFTVVTPTGTVEVLGTSFNVFDRGNQLGVSCLTGKVRVKSNNQEVTLVPGQDVTLKGKVLETGIYDPGQPTWRDGQFYYSDEPLVNVLEEVERQFNINIEVSGAEERIYTGNFSNENLEETLNIICTSMGFTWEMDEKMNVIMTAAHK